MNDTIQRETALYEEAIRIKDNAKKMIWVTFQKEGFHKFIQAGHREDLYDVSFLQYEHRHMFHFKVWIEVMHTDRDIEFIQFKRWLESLYNTKAMQLNYKSCEMIADDLFQSIAARYPHRDVWIQVAEDGENGCFNQYNK